MGQTDEHVVSRRRADPFQNGEFIRRFTLVMVNDLQNPSGAGVEIRCVSHATYGISRHLPSGPQICGLAIRFRNMVKDAGWERSFWELYDFEGHEIALRFDEISLHRVETKDLMLAMMGRPDSPV